MRGYVYVALATAALALVAYAGHSLYEKGYADAEMRYQAEVAKAVTKARAEEQRRDTASAESGKRMLDFLARELPASEAKTNETIERIRVVYRDRPAPALCVWPDGVRDELAAAIRRANGTTR